MVVSVCTGARGSANALYVCTHVPRPPGIDQGRARKFSLVLEFCLYYMEHGDKELV